MAGKRKTKTPKQSVALGPSKWRLQHGGFGDAVRSADPETGTPIAHRYAMDTLGVMLGNGTITSEMRDAGEMFRKQFRCAALDTLRAMPLIRIPGGRAGDTTTEQQFQARERVAAAIDALGGPGSPAGACVWHVVGLESSITEWARRSGWCGRPIGHAQGQGVLVSALGVLAMHYGLTQRRAA
ncbi:MAG: hypothetical protein K2X49_02465 [Acetobacteraceae bacterium]|nr:hypothetical protein [Acetobacteraceae bacterium]